MGSLDHIELNPLMVGGKPIIRAMRITLNTIVGLIASGHTFAQILDLYPDLEEADI